MDASDQELQQYLFDLQGYLVIHDVLGAAEVAELNRLIDAQRLPSPRERIRFGSAAGKHGPDHGFLNWGEPFCRLLDHEGIMSILRFRLGDCFRLDRLYGIRMHKGQTMGAMHADYGASALNPNQPSATTSRSVRCQCLSVAMLGGNPRRWDAMSKKGLGGERRSDARWSRQFARAPRCDRWRGLMTSPSPRCSGGSGGPGTVPWTMSIGATIRPSRGGVVEPKRR